MEVTQTPVLVVGAGPAGLTLALFLARCGVKTLVVEKHNSTLLHPRARGLNVRTMEIFRTLGLEEAVISAGKALAKSRFMLFVESLAGPEIRRVPDEELMAGGELLAQFSPTIFSQCAQDELEPLLLSEARRYGAQIRFGTEFVALKQTEAGVSVTLRHTDSGSLETLECQYLIAADGANSSVRQALKLAMPGLSPGDVPGDGRGSLGDYINIYFQADLTPFVKERWFGICFIENPKLEAVLLPVNNSDRWLLNVSYQPSQAEPSAFTPARCLELVQAAVGTDQLPISVLSILPWQAAARLVEQMEVGRVFLMGDAAHLMPPAGGFGLNTAVQDAHNLAWKLAAVLELGASSKLLETYQSERWPVAEAVVNQAVADLTAPTPDYLPAANNEATTTANGGAEDWDDSSGWAGEAQDPRAALLEQLRLILGYRYTSSAIIAEPKNLEYLPHQFKLSGEPGTRAPHIWLKHGKERYSSLDLLKNYKWVLLTGSQGQSWLEAVEKLNNKLNFRLEGYQIGGYQGLDGLTPDSWTEAYGVSASGAVLVRPDQFIAWRVPELEKNELAYSVLVEILGQLLGNSLTS